MDKNQEKVIRHLEMIQKIIDRMGRNSFLLKGWSVVLVSASIWLIAKNDQMPGNIQYVSLFAVGWFWILDGYFLRQERLFRRLYEKVRKNDDTDFSMNPSEFVNQVPGWWLTCIGPPMPNTLLIFYAPLMVAVCFLF